MIPNFSDCDTPISHKGKGKGKHGRTAKTEKKKFKRVQVDTGDTQAIRL